MIVDAGKGLFKAKRAAHLNHIPGNRRTGERVSMSADKKHKPGEDSMGDALSSFGTSTKSAQAITAEVIDYAKKSFEGSAAAWERLLGAKTLDQAAEIQSEYLKSAFEDFVARTTKLGELYVDLAKEMYQPFAGVFAKGSPIK
jgi:phasin family protein